MVYLWLLYLVLLFVIALTCWLLTRYSFLEEPLGEKLRAFTFMPSPSIKLVTTFIGSIITSVSYIIVLLAVVTSVMLAGSATASNIMSTAIDLNVDLGSGVYLRITEPRTLIELSEAVNEEDVLFAALRILTPITFSTGDKTQLDFLVLALGGRYAENITGYVISSEEFALLDKSLRSYVKSLTLGRWEFKPLFVDLSRLTKIRLAENIPLVHSTGSIGFTVITVSNVSRLILLPFRVGLELVSKKQPNIDAVVILSEGYEPSEFLRYDCEVGVVNGTRLLLITALAVPTVESLGRAVVSTILAAAVMTSCLGGIMERTTKLSSALSIVGVTPSLSKLSAELAILMPIIAVGAVAGYIVDAFFGRAALLSSLLSLIMLTGLTALMLNVRMLRGGEQYIPAMSTTVTSLTVRKPAKIYSCIRDMVMKDEFFEVVEDEYLDVVGGGLARFRMLYRLSVGIGVEMQCYIARRGNELTITVTPVAWSLEEVSARELRSVIGIAMARVLGAVKLCTLK
ncbi:MAG: hypothetical protein DRO12_04250 [Thermoprotei archaeon]|nr:MAG: hypothetical protein DRO12_04250 [Thermoprotei archaeon]